MSPISGQFGNGFNWQSLLQTSPLGKETQRQLSVVYLALAATVLSAAVGAAASIQYHLFTSPLIPSILAFFCMLGLTAMQPSKSNEKTRIAMLLTFGFLDGCALGPLIETAIHFDPAVLVTALMSTTAVFACFSIAALSSQRRSLLYLGGFLSSTFSFMCLASFINMFFQSSMIPWVNVYFGLVVFCGFVMFDTQMIVEQIVSGNTNYITMALNLFVDFFAIFVRVLIILMNNEQKKRDDDNRRR